MKTPSTDMLAALMLLGTCGVSVINAPAADSSATAISMVREPYVQSATPLDASLGVDLLASCFPPPPGLVGWWPLNGDTSDDTGANPGTAFGGPTFSGGRVGQALVFDGIDDGLRIPASSGVNLGTNSGLSIEGWIRPDDLSQLRPIAEWNNGAGSIGVDFWTGVDTAAPGDGQRSLFAGLIGTDGISRNIRTPAGLLSTGVWQHVGLTYDKTTGTAALYHNGALVVSANVGVLTPQTSFDLYLGRRVSGPFSGISWKGALDEIALYQRALTPLEILGIYNAGASGKCPIASPPLITVQPEDQSVSLGGEAALTVAATGTAPLSYAWFHDGSPVPDATNSSFVIHSAAVLDAGAYAAVVSNNAGSITSRLAQVQVVPVQPCAPPPAGLVSWWSLDGSLSDHQGTNLGLALGDPVFSSGKVGQALVLDGVDDTVRIPASSSLDVGTGSGLSIEGWIRPDDLSQLRPIAEWNNGAGSIGVDFWTGVDTAAPGDGQRSLFAGLIGTDGISRNIRTPAGLLSTGVWQHVGLTYDKTTGTAALYHNGALVVSANVGVLTPQTSFDLYLGRRVSGPFSGISWKGALDEIALYQRTLTPVEVKAIYDAGISGECGLPTPPQIITQPADLALSVGDDAELTVVASDTGPLSYLWIHDGTPVETETSPVLQIHHASSADAGGYFVVVANAGGAVTSRVALVTVEPIPSCGPAPAGLVGWWRLNGDSSDFLGGSAGLLLGGPTFVAGEAGQGVRFDGVDDAVRIPGSPSLNAGKGPGLTIEAWIRPDDLSQLRPIAEWNNGTGSIGVDFWTGVDTGAPGDGQRSLFAGMVGTDGVARNIRTASGLVSTSVWQHVAVTYDKTSGDAVIYYNGVSAASNHVGSFDLQTSYDLYFGRRVSGPFSGISWKGDLDEISIYQRALSAQEIADIFNAGAGGKCPEPLAPTIVLQPHDQTAILGQQITFAVSAVGTPPLQYQWRFQGASLEDATNATLVLSHITLAQAGDYSVVVTNAGGAVTSSNATLTVVPTRTLALGSPQAAHEGSSVSLALDLVSHGEVGGMTFALRYNSNYLRNAQLVLSPELPGLFSSVNDDVPGEIRATLALASAAIPPGTQALAAVTFLLRSVPNDLDTPVTVQWLDVSTPAGDAITVGNLTADAEVHILRRVYLGDNNANQRLDVGDATLILRMLSQLEPTRSWDVTGNDLNQNHVLDTGDAIKVLRAAAGIDPQPGGGDQGPAFAPASADFLPGRMEVSPSVQRGNASGTVTYQIKLQDIGSAIAGTAFSLDYPTNALRLINAASYHTGPLVPANTLAVWNLAPSAGDFAAQDGHLSLAVSGAMPWPLSNGVLVELTFQVQTGATNRYAWPLALRGAEITFDGFRNRFLLAGGGVFIGRNPVPGLLTSVLRNVEGQFAFNINGDVGATYEVEASTDLMHWNPVTTLFNSSGTVPFVDPDSGNFARRFYRVRPLTE